MAEYDDVVKQAKQSDETVHFGRVFPMAHKKNHELAPELRKYKGE